MEQTAAVDTRVLFWSCADQSNLIAAVVRQSLDAWQASSQTHHQRIVIDHPLDARQLGLAVWAVTAQTQLMNIVNAIDSQQRSYPQIFQLVFLAGELMEYRGLLIEAGANFVVTQLCDLQSVILKSVDRLQVNHHGYHPLTSGLISRLPWK